MSFVFDPQSEAFARDPYAIYAELRELDEPFYYAGADSLLLSRYQDVESAARNASLVRSLEGILTADEIAAQQRQRNWHDMPNHERFVQHSMLETDGDAHFRQRVVILRELSRRFVEGQHGMIQRHVDRLLDRVCDLREFDFVTDFASHIPGFVIGNILGAPDEDCPRFRTWSEDVVQFFDTGRTEAHKALAESATTECYHYLKEMIAERTREPRADLVSALVAASNNGEMDETELVSTCMLVLMGGHGSTIDVLGSGMHTLLQFPGELQRLRDNPDLVEKAVHEMFRYESPLPFFHRYASEDVEIMGQRYSKGTKFGLLYGSANRDPAQFSEADRFDIGRHPNSHVAFGRGAHLCLGNHLARLDMQVIFLTLLQRTQSIELMDDTVSYKQSLSERGPLSLKVRLTPA